MAYEMLVPDTRPTLYTAALGPAWITSATAGNTVSPAEHNASIVQLAAIADVLASPVETARLTATADGPYLTEPYFGTVAAAQGQRVGVTGVRPAPPASAGDRLVAWKAAVQLARRLTHYTTQTATGTPITTGAVIQVGGEFADALVPLGATGALPVMSVKEDVNTAPRISTVLMALSRYAGRALSFARTGANNAVSTDEASGWPFLRELAAEYDAQQSSARKRAGVAAGVLVAAALGARSQMKKAAYRTPGK